MKKTLKKILNNFSNITDLNILLVANAVKQTERLTTYTIEYAVNDEFFSTDEFAEIASGLLNSHNFLNIFYTETDFINYILKEHKNVETSVVYNLARNGKKEGKKSLIPAFCDLMGLPYTGSNAFVISLCRNKYVWSSLAKLNNINVPDFFIYDSKSSESNKEIYNLLNKTIIVKNIFESASIGMTKNNIFKLSSEKKLKDYCSKFSSPVLIEEFIKGYECEVPFFILNEEVIVLDPVLIKISKESIITSEISNSYDYSFDLLKEYVSDKCITAIKESVKKLAKLLNIQVYGRIDFRIDENEHFFIIDIAATPYTIKHSSFAFLFDYYELTYEDIYKIILNSTLEKASML